MSGLKIVYNRIDAIQRMFPGETSAILLKTAMEVETNAKISMGETKHGKDYRRGKKAHRASAPGEAPAIDTGNLVNSLRSEMENPTTAVVSVDAEYAQALEFGTSTIAARPFLRPALEKAKNGFIDAFRRLEGRLG